MSRFRRMGGLRPAMNPAVVVLWMAAVFWGGSAALGAVGSQQYRVDLDINAGSADRQDSYVDAAIDLTSFLATIPGTLDVLSLQVLEVDLSGNVLDDSVLFQFDEVEDFDPTTNAAGNLVFRLAGSTPAGTDRHFRLAFDLAGACPDCPAPPPVPVPVAVDSLTYENQLTYEVTTPRATYRYHKQGAGLASLIDNDANDWISFHDVPGSHTAGEYRGIPNLVFTEGDAANSFFHPGFTNGSSRLVSAGPLKVTVRSQAGPPENFWETMWEFYPDYARLTVLSAGPGDGGTYWLLYEGTIGGSMDAGDVVVRSDGTQTSAFSYGEVWEANVPAPEWVYFRDTTAPRALYVSVDQPDSSPDSYRPQGQTSGATPEMSVFGFGRVLNTSPNSLEGRLTGVGRTFTVGLVEDHTTADAEIAGAVEPLTVQVGTVVDNGGPVAADDGYALPEDDVLVVAAVGGVLANDTPDAAGPLTAVLQSDVTHGVLNLNADGSFDYTPAADFAGLDSFTYRAFEAGVGSNTATVTLTVDPVNDAPVAVADDYLTTTDTPLVVDAAAGVLANDSDVDLDSLQAVLAADVTNGVLNLNADGSFDYTPAGGFVGVDGFTYRASDGPADSLATVQITVVGPPTAGDDAYATDEDVTLVVPAAAGVLANDTADVPADGVTAVLQTGPTHGTLTAFAADGGFSYTPDPDYNGPDGFTYLAVDGGTGATAEATVTLTINAVNDAPVALDDEYQSDLNQVLSVPAAGGVLANDTDADTDPLQAILVTDVMAGTLSLAADGSFDYTPDLDFVGSDSFTYRASDGLADSLATVTLTITDPSALVRVTDGLVVLYDFAAGGGGTVPDVSNVGQPLDLAIDDTTAVTWLPGGGLSLDTATIVRSSGPAAKLITAATATDAITVEAWLAPASVAQNGPARIVSLSGSAVERDFTLGQGVYNAGDDRYVMRLRTTTTTLNGTPETQTPVGSLTTDLTHVVYTRDGTGAVTMYLDGNLALAGFTGGDFSNWDASHELLLGNEVTEDRPWLGSFYLLAVYDHALSLAEIAQNFTAGPQGDPIPSAPVIRSAPVTAATVGETYVYDVVASGYPSPVFSLATAPAGMTIDPATGTINWTPGAAGNETVEVVAGSSEGSDSQLFDITVYATNPIQLQVFHGLDQRVGHLGTAQTDFNVMGNVSPAASIATLSYNLNGGLYQGLTLGPDARRLPAAGDFNADIPIGLLQVGPNTVKIRAVATSGQVSTVTVNVTRETGGSYPLPADITWSGVSDPQDVGQYVDGQWQLDGGGLRTQTLGYDRIFLIGEDTWQDYEILVPVTINQVLIDEAGLGLLTRFTGHIIGGHRDWPVAQPKWGYQPFGGIGWLRWVNGPAGQPVKQFFHGDFDTEDNFGTADVVVGNTYLMRMRCETQPDAVNGDGVTLYSWKVWESGSQEPGGWDFQVSQQSPYALREGGVALLAHHVDATFGDVQVTGLTSAPLPVANNDAYATPEDTPLVIDAAAGVLANDAPAAAGPLTAVLQNTTANGALVLAADGSFTYTPGADFAGSDSFTYRAYEDGVGSAAATVTIAVSPSNDPPVAVPDSYLAATNTLLQIAAAAGVLANDSDVDGDSLQAVLATDVGSGVLVLNGDGSFDYTPNPAFTGTDSFTYRASDGLADSLATVLIEVAPPPTAGDDSYATDEDVTLVVPAPSGVLANDAANDPADGVTAVLSTGPANGSLSAFGADGSFTYVPNPDFNGPDSFTYLAVDGGTGATVAATVTLTIDPVGDAPVAVADGYLTPVNTPLAVAAAAGVLANDSDADLEPLQAVLATDVSSGSLQLNADGSFDYTPNPDFVGSDSFTYRASDGVLDSLATVTLTVNDPLASTRVTDGLLVLYDFAAGGGDVVPDVSGIGTAMDLAIGDTSAVTWLPGGGLSLDTATIVRSTGPATKVIDAAGLTNAITVEAWLTPASLTQNGPARIVTCSASGSERNFTLGQGVYAAGDDRYVMRLRTTTTDDNGIPETQAPVGSLTTDLTHVVFTRDGTGAVTIHLDADLSQSGFTGGTFANWAAGYDFALGNEMSEDRPWLGAYHLVAVYDRALTLAEIAQNFTVGPHGQAAPSAPVIRSTPVTAATVGDPYVYEVVTTGFPAPVYTLTSAPTGMSIDAVTGVVSWTPDAAGDYPVEITASSGEGSDSQAFTLTVYATSPVQLTIWHGPDQQVGHLGPAQADFNVLGNVGPVAAVASLTYNLNGGLYQALSMGPDNLRLEAPGDFNADIPLTLLQPGLNVVTVRAVATSGLVQTATLNLTLAAGGSSTLPTTIDWSAVSDPQDVGQYVDGRWQLDGPGLRTQETGYDRIFLIGEDTWRDYEILVPITINEVLADGAGLGFIMRFTGHVVGGHRNWPEAQPKWGYQPFGGIGWLRWTNGPASDPVMQFFHGDYDIEDDFGVAAKMVNDPSTIAFGAPEHVKAFGQAKVEVGLTYRMRMRCETQPDAVDGDGVTLYSWKVWEAGTPEPSGWDFQVTQESAFALREGGVALLAHDVDATFGDVQVVDVDVASGVDEGSDAAPPSRFVIHHNYPNPFNPSTSIAMDLPRASAARVGIYDMQGRRVRSLYSGQLDRGRHTFRWDGRDDAGRGVSGGVYFFRLEAEGYVGTRKMSLVK